MAGFERGDNAFILTQQIKGLQRGIIVGGMIFHAANVGQMAVFRADAGVVQTGGDRMGAQYLAAVVLHQIAAETVQHADGCFAGNRRGVVGRVYAVSARFYAD